MAEDVSSDVTDRMFDLNTLGPIKLARAALSHMLRRRCESLYPPMTHDPTHDP